MQYCSNGTVLFADHCARHDIRYMLLTKSCVQRYCTSVAYYKDMYNMNQISYSGHRREASQDTGTWFFTYTYECMN